MKKLTCIFACVVLLTSLTFPGHNTEKKPPNILFILADDLGRECVSSYGSDIFKTPNIDRLAREGVMFTHAFSNPYCTPTRSELLTGRYPFATNTSRVIYDYKHHKDMVLDVSEPSFARQLQQVGYKTAIAGKWQLSFLAKQDWVHEFGFDSYMLWQIMTDKDERTTRFHNPYFRKDGKVIADEIKDRYGPDVMVDYLIDFMKESHKEGKPFMAYYTSLLPHFPWVPTPDSEDQTIPGDVGSQEVVRGNPKFFPAMVDRLDHQVGRLMDALDDLGITRDTIVIFLADNGTDQQLYSSIHGQIVLGGKGTLTDRATQVPLLIRWPGKIKPGSVDDALVKVADFLPTLCELGKAPLPQQPIHGQSFAARLTGNRAGKERSWVFIQMADESYLRSKDWIVTDKGEYKKVQPYPKDAEEVDPETLNKATRQYLEQLRAELIALKNGK